jgi:hypothetical protein
MLRAMRRIVQTTATIPFASSGRRDLLFELLALHHQLSVLARSNRRLRSPDRLLWLILRRVWPRWREALMLVQPATVDRWSRDGFSVVGRVVHDGLEDHGSTPNVAASFSRWPPKTASGVLRGFTESSSSWASRFRNGRCPGTCESAQGDRHRPGARSSRITTTSSPSSRRSRPYRARMTSSTATA